MNGRGRWFISRPWQGGKTVAMCESRPCRGKRLSGFPPRAGRTANPQLLGAHLRPLGRAVGSVIPVLGARDVGDPPLVAVPAVEAIHPQHPDAGPEIFDDDE